MTATSSSNTSSIDIGFPEKCDPWKLTSKYFPSKAGGKPAWLDLEGIPTANDLQCSNCEHQMVFLAQIYAPFDQNDGCFHRTIFVFACKTEKCYKPNDSHNLRVFRSQLGRSNKFYSFEPPETKDDGFSLESLVKICSVCGCPGDKKCAKCKKAQYCSREHQILDWKAGHKDHCSAPYNIEYANKLILPEFELVIEPEELPEETPAEDEQRQMQEFEKLKAEGKIGSMSDVPEEDLSSYASVKEDKTFSKFKKRISSDPDQVVRYERAGKPLWVAKAGQIKAEEVPDCEYCGSKRQFEFQILPQLLNSIKDPNMDWGTLLVYTCSISCSSDGPNYKKEYIVKQDITESLSLKDSVLNSD